MKTSTATFIALMWILLLVLTIYCAITLLKRMHSPKVKLNKGLIAEQTFATTEHPKINFASNGELLGINKINDIKVVNSKYFGSLVHEATSHPRKRRINDFTRNPSSDGMQILLNTFIGMLISIFLVYRLIFHLTLLSSLHFSLLIIASGYHTFVLLLLNIL